MKFTRDEIIQRAIDINCELLRKTNFNSNNLDYHAHAYIDRLIHYDCENYVEVPKPTGKKYEVKNEQF